MLQVLSFTVCLIAAAIILVAALVRVLGDLFARTAHPAPLIANDTVRWPLPKAAAETAVRSRAARYEFAFCVAVAPLLLLSARALGDGVPVTITNDGTEDIMVTIYDTTSRPREVLLSQRINGFSSVPLQMSPDASGRANLAWTAVTVDPNHRRCGHAKLAGLADGASVSVHADMQCAAT